MGGVGIGEAHPLLRGGDLVVVGLVLEGRVVGCERVFVGEGRGGEGGLGRRRETVDVLFVAGGDSSESVRLRGGEGGVMHLLVGGVRADAGPNGVWGLEGGVVGGDGCEGEKAS